MHEQKFDALHVIALDGHVQRRQTVLGARVHRRAAVEKEADDAVLAAPRGAVQRRQTVLRAHTQQTKRRASRIGILFKRARASAYVWRK